LAIIYSKELWFSVEAFLLIPGSQQPKMPLDLPFSGAYWVLPSQLLAGPFPGAADPLIVARNARGLMGAGIRHIISLLEEHEIASYGRHIISYESALAYLGNRMGIEVSLSKVPIEDMSIPSPRVMKSILDEVDLLLLKGKPVYIHCWAGRGRTGTVIGCYLVRHGHSGDEALRVIKEMRAKALAGDLISPETKSQRDLVRAWKRLDRNP
jgi:predicted protein tyrosine phosphatase